jgi:molybdate transport system substrate-binding protein
MRTAESANVFGALLAALALLPLGPAAVQAESTTVAAAANFITPLEALKPAFEGRSGHTLTIVAGSTGQLYAQILNGAPFDVLLSADQEHPEMLVAAGHGDASQRFTYARGKLVLWTRDAERFEPLSLDTLRRTDYRWLAIANPDLAPYGLAARRVLEGLGLWDTLQDRLVRGQNIAQTFAMAETRNADLALVALSQAIAYSAHPAAYVEIREDLHEPIRQDAILLRRASGNAAARAFLDFLRSAEAARVIEGAGYAVPRADAPDR